MEQAQSLLKLWLDMLAISETDNRPAFRSAQQAFNQLYRRSDNTTQGLYHALAADNTKQWTKAHPNAFADWQRENGFA